MGTTPRRDDERAHRAAERDRRRGGAARRLRVTATAVAAVWRLGLGLRWPAVVHVAADDPSWVGSAWLRLDGVPASEPVWLRVDDEVVAAGTPPLGRARQVTVRVATPSQTAEVRDAGELAAALDAAAAG